MTASFGMVHLRAQILTASAHIRTIGKQLMISSKPHITTLTRDEISQFGALTDTAGVSAVLGISERHARWICENDDRLKAVKIGRNWRVSTESLIAFAGLE